MAKHPRPDRHTGSPDKSSSRTQPAIAIHADTRALYCTHVQQRLWPSQDQRSRAPTLHQPRQHCISTSAGQSVWSQATLVHMDIPDFQDWGWHKDSSGRWLLFWTTLEDSSKACCILLQCRCVKSCTRNCNCSRAGVCWTVANVKGGCVNNEETWKYIMYLCPYLIDWFIDWTVSWSKT